MLEKGYVRVKLIKFMFSRLAIFGLILFVQVVWIFVMIVQLGEYSTVASGILGLLSILVTLWIIYKDDNPAYKLAWIVPILLVPIVGGLLYIAMGNKKPPKRYQIALEQLNKNEELQMVQQEDILQKIIEENPHVGGQVHYLSKTTGYPIYANSKTEYFSIGEEYYCALLEELKKAKHYIFMEYFIVEEGYMWNCILDILQEKAKQWVDVRFIYDDMGCVSLLPIGYYKRLEHMGIKAIAFNPFVPFISVAMNNRDHRKITVIDGHTAFTGGINLADEYINEKVRFGHWKDTGICIRGEAVWNFTVMFLRMWNIHRKTDDNFSQYRPEVYAKECSSLQDKEKVSGFVQPYGDTPLDSEITGESVYLNIINAAKRYVYIFTPYLIVDHEMITALTLAAKRGVDVRIVTPGIPDKKTVFALTRSYYLILQEGGVKIYEYTPGFLHAKCFVCDDEIATVGTINMDYRSLYLHFECGVYLYKTSTVMDVKRDIDETIKKSKKMELCDIKSGTAFSIFRAILRLFAPLM